VTLIASTGDTAGEEYFTIIVTPVNDPPVITTSAPTTATIGVFYTYDPDADDPENDPMEWSLSNEPQGMTIDSMTGEINWAPPEGMGVSPAITLTVSDGNIDGTNSQTFTISITEINRAPFITSTAPTQILEGDTYIYNPTATDEDGDTLTWSLADEPDGMTIASETGAISWVPAEGVLTSPRISLLVSDGLGGVDYEEIIVTILPDDDQDGVPDLEEKGPDGTDSIYDGNADGLVDHKQDNVVSFHTNNGTYYVTIASEEGTVLADVHALANPSESNTPAGVTFDFGFFDYTAENVAFGATIVTLYLPEGSSPNTFYMYGKIPDNEEDHWYEFMFDEGTQTGAKIEGNVVTLYFRDGLRGDNDLTANGSIEDAGAPGIKSTNPDNGNGSGGGSGGCFIDSATSHDTVIGYFDPERNHMIVIFGMLSIVLTVFIKKICTPGKKK